MDVQIDTRPTSVTSVDGVGQYSANQSHESNLSEEISQNSWVTLNQSAEATTVVNTSEIQGNRITIDLPTLVSLLDQVRQNGQQ